jgi:hypothetical protein
VGLRDSANEHIEVASANLFFGGCVSLCFGYVKWRNMGAIFFNVCISAVEFSPPHNANFGKLSNDFFSFVFAIHSRKNKKDTARLLGKIVVLLCAFSISNKKKSS